jgi:hypothetical protein
MQKDLQAAILARRPVRMAQRTLIANAGLAGGVA